MSWQALDWAGKQRVGHAHSKAVLIMLANYADEHATCYPSHEQLGGVLEVSVRTIQECVKRLEHDGYVATKRDRHADGKLGLTRYRLILDRPKTVAPPEAASDGPPEAPPAETTGSSFRSEPPPESTKESKEREPAREVEHPTAAEALDAALKAWPNPALQNPDLALAAMERRSATDRQLLNERIPDFLAFHKAEQPSAKLPFLHNYIGQENRWRDLPQRPKAEAKHAADAGRVPAFGRSWWWLFRQCAAGGSSGQLRRNVSAAQQFAGAWHIDPEKRAEIDASAARELTQHPKDGDHAQAWRTYYRSRSVDMPIPDKAQWVWLPPTKPPDVGKPMTGLSPADRDFAAEGTR